MIHARRPLRLPAALAANAPLWAALLPAAVFAITVIRLCTTQVDPDYWWHLATGRWLLDHGRIPATDPFSFSAAGKAWYAHEWLGELLIGVADRIGGYAAGILLTALLVTLAAWLVWRAARCYGVAARAATLLTLAGGFFLIRYFAVRPQVWTWALFALLLHELAAHDSGGRRRLWLVPALFALWINVHLSALIGLAALGLYTLCLALRWLLARGSAADTARAAFMHLAAVGALSAIALMLNPRGPALLWWSRLYLNQNVVYYRYISEWQRLKFAGFNQITYVAGGVLVGLTLLALVRRRTLWPGVLGLAFAFAAVRAIRYVPLFALAAVPVAGWLAGRYHGRLRRPQPARVAPRFAGVLALTVLAAIALIAPALPSTQFRRTPLGSVGGFPAETAVWIAANRPDATLFNDYNWGGYLVYRFYGQRRVYIDGRTEMYGERFFDRFIQTTLAQPGWQQTLADSGAALVLIDPKEPLAHALAADPGWRLVFREADVAVLYAPATAAAR